MTDLDIWRSANILLKRYGGEAVFIASKRADALLDQGDVQGSLSWVRIAKAITDLERKAAGNGDRVH
jgi:triphosphoribosyl-dephospho-CoA synthetase